VGVVFLVIVAIIVAVVLGIAVIGLALKLLWWALLGLVIGGLARLVLPGMQPIGGLATIGAGIAGAIVGGVIGDALDWGGLLQFALAVAVAAGVIAVFGGSRRQYA
jgi:uncharacterized membrane protein YeaQ/YmgE (transglycosylase-associated protein family)